MMQELDDRQLASLAAQKGDRRAFGVLVERHQSAVRRFLLGQTMGDSQLADDLAQDTFVKAWLHIGQYRAEAGFRTWLFRIAYNVLYDYRRHERPTSDIDDPTLKVRPDHPGSTGEKLDLQEAFRVLNDMERTCITLQLVNGESIERIALITGQAEGTIKSQLSRGKKKLAQYLRNNGYA